MPANVSNDKIYELIDRARIELKGDVLRLETKFDNLEAGRLTRLEEETNRLRVRDATLSTKVYMLVFIISSVVSSVIAAITMNLIGKH